MVNKRLLLNFLKNMIFKDKKMTNVVFKNDFSTYDSNAINLIIDTICNCFE